MLFVVLMVSRCVEYDYFTTATLRDTNLTIIVPRPLYPTCTCRCKFFGQIFFSTLPLFRQVMTLRPESAQYVVEYHNYIYFILLPHVFACDTTVI